MNSETAEDQFDRLPDSLLLLIFSKLPDAQSLTVCLSVSKRFASLIPLSDAVFLPIRPRKRHPAPNRGSNLNLNLFTLLRKELIAKSLRCFNCFTDSEPATDPHREEEEEEEEDGDCYYWARRVLKNFIGIKSLYIELPSHGSRIRPFGNDSLLKWHAEFGSELKSCVVLEATSFQKGKLSSLDQIGEEHQIQQTLTEDELTSRVVWTFSCLISASARHFLFKQLVTEHPELQQVVISDANKQGELRMGSEELSEIRNSQEDSEMTLWGTSEVPEKSLKLWYVPVLELPVSGWVMRGASLAVITGSDGEMEEENGEDDPLVGCFDGEGEEEKAFSEAVRKMMKVKESYLMTISSL
ncbi:hypothetical protein SLEP1_g27216 [Rubroshorea leprosula]|uniref:F-box domain-containing protein n=1 Tax=Rubroshorea leprosula TaxID=152421 RepID=A0AAV5JPU4_9ROSI|nr:hypothetical protein SLEP1_g27216 [Rubroshorea leprosula]